jgi:molecular chaperone GrpE
MSEDSNDLPTENSAEPAEGQELSELKKQYLYLRADFENYKKNAIKERSDLIKFGAEPVLREFLSVLDTLERAAEMKVTPDTIDQFKEGIKHLVTQFKKTLERFGVEEVATKGEAFDPNIHEALSSVNDPELAPNAIAEVFRKAYKLHGKVIRPAQVVVNTSSPKGNS